MTEPSALGSDSSRAGRPPAQAGVPQGGRSPGGSPGHAILARPGGAPDRPGASPRALRSWRRWAVGVACVVLLAVAVHAEEPMIAQSLRSFAYLRWRPAVLAVAAETASMVALGLMERRILILAGLRLPVARSVAIAYASNALSASLPVIGSGAATAFTYRRLVSQGATPALAGWALVLAGVVSNAAFVLIISIGAVVSGSLAAIWAGGAGILLTLVVAGVAALAMRRPGARERVSRAAIWTLSRVQHLVHRPAGDAAGIVADVTAGLAAFRPNRGDVIRAVVSAVRNWTFDLFCLVFSLKAAGVHVPWWGIILAWAAGTGGASLNLTPGGLGVVEAALTAALVALGVPGAPALTAVLLYRAITFWLAIAVGWAIYLYLRREQEPSSAKP